MNQYILRREGDPTPFYPFQAGSDAAAAAVAELLEWQVRGLTPMGAFTIVEVA